MKAKSSTLLCGVAAAVLSAPVLCAPQRPNRLATAQASTQAPANGPQLEQVNARFRLMQEQMRRLHTTHNPQERSRLLQDHMRAMLTQMQAMRSLGRQRHSSVHGGQMQGREVMRHGAMGGAMMGRGRSSRGASNAAETQRAQWMRQRLEMQQMLMQQMLEQMRAMQQTRATVSGK